MVNCDFCGKTMGCEGVNKKNKLLNDGNYCEECSNKGIDELFNEILEDDEIKEPD